MSSRSTARSCKFQFHHHRDSLPVLLLPALSSSLTIEEYPKYDACVSAVSPEVPCASVSAPKSQNRAINSVTSTSQHFSEFSLCDISHKIQCSGSVMHRWGYMPPMYKTKSCMVASPCPRQNIFNRKSVPTCQQQCTYYP